MIILRLFSAVETVQNCPAESSRDNCLTNLPQIQGQDTSQIVDNLPVVFGVAAGVALISLLIAAFNYATAGTDAEKISRSKNAIVFSLVGLVITLSAEAIVLTLLGKL